MAFSLQYVSRQRLKLIYEAILHLHIHAISSTQYIREKQPCNISMKNSHAYWSQRTLDRIAGWGDTRAWRKLANARGTKDARPPGGVRGISLLWCWSKDKGYYDDHYTLYSMNYDEIVRCIQVTKN